MQCRDEIKLIKNKYTMLQRNQMNKKSIYNIETKSSKIYAMIRRDDTTKLNNCDNEIK